MYHSGALVGNDVNKVTKTENISKICDVFKPKTVTLSSGIKKTFGSYELAQVLKTRFIKFRDCYRLYMENRHLCRHEVLKLCVRSYRYGNWFPINFKDENLSRKFHMLTYEVPRKAIMSGTVGREAEHCSEAVTNGVGSTGQYKMRSKNLH